MVEPYGALLAFNPSWRAVYASLGTCGIWLFLSGLFLFDDDRPEQPPEHGFDFAGVALFMALLGLVFLLLYRGNYLGWHVSTPICIAVAALVVGLPLFVWRELVAPEPFIDLGGFAFRTVALTMLTSAFWCASLYGIAILLPDCLLALGYEHWKTGWVILPAGLIVAGDDVSRAASVSKRKPIWCGSSGSAWPERPSSDSGSPRSTSTPRGSG